MTIKNLSSGKAVAPLDAHYWDTKNNRLVTLAKIGVAAVFGDEPDMAEQGDLNV